MKNTENTKIAKAEETADVLEQYVAQTAQSEDIHFSHADWVYTDGSDCCC